MDSINSFQFQFITTKACLFLPEFIIQVSQFQIFDQILVEVAIILILNQHHFQL